MTANIQGSASADRFLVLKTSESQLILDAAPGTRPSVLYWGPALENANPKELALLSVRQWTHGGTAVDVSASLSNELGAGVLGPPGVIVHRNSTDWAAVFRVTQVSYLDTHRVRIVCRDDNTHMCATYEIALDPDSHVLSAHTSIENLGKVPVIIDWCATLCLPLNRRLTRIKSFTGRWAMEFQQQTVPAFQGTYLRENNRGRPSHDNFPGLIATAEFTSEKNETAVGFHLGWSGNTRVRVDRHTDGRAFVQMGELFPPGEMVLEENDRYTPPTLYAAWSEKGLNQLAQRFHRHLRDKVMDPRTRGKARPVHYNTWEAV